MRVKKINGFTPREMSFDIMLGALRTAVHDIRTFQEWNGQHLNITQAAELIRQLVKRHNALLDISGLDGMEIS